MVLSHIDQGMVSEIMAFWGNFGQLSLSFIICKRMTVMIHRAVMRIM